MMRRRIMVLVFLSLLTLANAAGADEVTCEVPWYSGSVSCGSLFSLRPQETVTIEVLEVKNTDGDNMTECPEILIVDAQTQNIVAKFTTCRGQKKPPTYKNESKRELIIGLQVATPWSWTRRIKVRYTVR